MAGRTQDGSQVRVSFSALLRIRDDDRYVLFHSFNRPGSYGPPGGVFKHFDPATRLLEGFGYRPVRIDSLADKMKEDLRGFVPARSLRGLLAWFGTGAYREDAVECLQRELEEELEEVGLPGLADGVRHLSFLHVRTVTEESRQSGQLRRLEVYDLHMTDTMAARLRRGLLDAGADPAVTTVICASTAEIQHGRCGSALVGGQSAYLFGTTRTLQPLPPLR